jgi:hypothetical protein
VLIDDLKEPWGSPYVARTVQRLHRFAYIPRQRLDDLAAAALAENWGANHFALEKYIAVLVWWSLEQERFTHHQEHQIYFSAGCLQTRYGTPLYLVFERNNRPNVQPWALVYVGSSPSAPEYPQPPDIPDPPPIDRASEPVINHDHILQENFDRVQFLQQTPPVAQLCAIAGSLQWSINRGLQIPHFHYGTMNYIVPLYLQSRENITEEPDLVAPIQVMRERLLIRTVLKPFMPYANARVAVRRHDQLPSWLLHGWNQHASTLSERVIEGDTAEIPEGDPV